MICIACKNENQKSKVYISDVFYDLQKAQDRFFDEEGRWHVHDVNITTTKYQCSNNHVWSEVKHARCWCEKERTNDVY